MTPILFLGAGIMGAPMARNLHKAGYEVTAWNRSPEKLAPLARNGLAVIDNLDAFEPESPVTVIVMLSTGPVVDQVLFESETAALPLAARLPSGSTVICMSSIPVETAKRQAAALAERGVKAVDAPVSGGEKGAIEATLAIMAGGDAETIEQLRPMFLTLGRTVTHVGPSGAGQLAKLANQLIVGVTIGAVSEAFLLAQKGGVDLAALREALSGGFADSEILRQHGLRMIEQRFAPGAHATTQRKDLETAKAMGESLGLDLAITSLLTQLYQAMCEEGGGGLDHSALFSFLQKTSGNAP